LTHEYPWLSRFDVNKSINRETWFSHSLLLISEKKNHFAFVFVAHSFILLPSPQSNADSGVWFRHLVEQEEEERERKKKQGGAAWRVTARI